ncbi:dipeptidyl aminopeptidase KNAG_0M01470 [Huiozyma naganishii CBS 8797]|uniref:Dipeptidyl-peptidase IV n=1 Tax=Huiozyma naganishii (strain ATCC MYA-139 / BCRC 22969 / CBS 8797 / KCTC 17520 / NBRC 10181 / NCYC 3082 / Yp74L-3) TaxID=1071383 RepID=J7RDU0_HUIN7|nr:hypothetical protein KNAG_0M01470 [Kazachstania naganishii CBS 8797]CCK73000.1 hypothetical protein KNAG_0M01470 [Kazachstania naganishii CBS 8797]
MSSGEILDGPATRDGGSANGPLAQSIPDLEVERIPDSHFQQARRPLWSHVVRLALLSLLIIWGSVLVLKSINQLMGHGGKSGGNTGDGGDDKGHDRYRLPNPNVTDDGLLKVSLEHMRNSTFKPKFQTLQWVHVMDHQGKGDNGLYFTSVNHTYLVKSVVDHDYSKVLFEGETFVYEGYNLTVDNIVASPDLKSLLIRCNTVKNWRHSNFASYFVFDERSSTFHAIGDNIAIAQWSPTSDRISYVQDNNIYIYSLEDLATVVQVTDDGSSQVFNGRPDWVYEEEVFEDDKALWWSPQGDYLAFLKIDETDVLEYTIPYFVQDLKDTYPEMKSIKYPKSGTPNPQVELYVYNCEEDSLYESHMNTLHDLESILLTEVVWVANNSVLAKITDRSSDLLKVVKIDALEEDTTVIRSETQANNGWWEITHNTMYIPRDVKNGRPHDGYIDVLPIDGYNHLVYFTPVNSTTPKVLTRGKWEVVNGPISFDAELNRVFFVAKKKSSMENHVYYINLSNPEEVVAVSDTSAPGVYDISFSGSCKYALLTYKGPKVPYQKIISLQGGDESIEGSRIGRTLFYLEDNELLKTVMADYEIPAKRFRELDLGLDENGQKILVNSFEILPSGFNEKLRDYYPVFFYAYGGPNSQQVVQTFSVTFNEVVSAQLDAIVVVVDGRGTGFKGTKFRTLVHDHLGSVETEDQIAAAKMYAKKPYVDSNKISLFGWSYGGYLTLKTLERDAGKYFKYGMAVAPVTDWRLYDSVYTERYMHTPQDNPEGYSESSVNNVESLAQAKRVLLMHGTGDDNVHFQNSLILMDKLNLASITNYDVHVFPDSDHSISYHNANAIVYDRLLQWAKRAYTGQFLEE